MVPDLQLLFRRKTAVATSKFWVEVFVDQSASMHGYLDYEHNWVIANHPTAKAMTINSASADPPPASSFVRLLREFANEEELVGYFGFGIDSTGVQTIIPYGKTPPVDPRLYVKRNNDYADLLKQFASRPVSMNGDPIERVIITDGVQSDYDLGLGSALNQTVQELREWIEKGGAVEVRLMTAPFAGMYYSEELRSRRLPYSYRGRAANRPFIAISLIRSPADLPAWERFWQRNAFSGLSTIATLRWPVEPLVATSIALEPELIIQKDVPVDVIYRNVWDLSPVVTLDGYKDIWRAFIRHTHTPTNADPPTYPACFLLKGLTEADAAAELRKMNPTLEVWQGPAMRRSGSGGELSKKGSARNLGEGEWQRVERVDLRDFNNGRVSVKPVADPVSGHAFRFTATLGVPARNTVRAVVLVVTPPAQTPPAPDWKTASTLNDSSPDDLTKIYNLQPFVEQLTDQNVRESPPIGLLVLTYR